MAEISIPTFEQLSVMMSHLLTNYTELARVYWDMFYSTTPTTLTLKIYNEDGELIDVEVPNRALDFNFVRNGEGSPEGNVSAPIGTTYQDTLNGKLYIKELGDGNTGWKLIGSDEGIKKGDSNPEGLITGTRGDLYEDRSSCSLYIKTTETGNTGWILINANVENLADRDLSNLAPAGQSIIDSKENVSNKTQVISGNSADKYTSERAVKNYVIDVANTKANISLDNLTATGEAHFANPDLSNLSYTGQNRINSKANVDLDNLSELGEIKTSKLIPYSIASGHLNGQDLDLVDVQINYDTTYSFAERRTYEVYVPIDGWYNVALVAGGGSYASFTTGDWDGGYAYSRGYGGGSGSAFSGQVYLTVGNYQFIIGGLNEDSYFKNGSTTIIQAHHGESVGSAYYSKTLGGPGGAAPTLNSSYQFQSTSTTAGNAGTSRAGDWGTGSGTGGNPVYGSYGAGQGGSGGTGGANTPGSTVGFGQIKITNQGSTEVFYKISGDYPLELVTKDGILTKIYGVNNDQLTGLADGRYNKFVDETGSDFIKNNIYRTLVAPSSPATNDVWIKKTFPIEVYKYNGTTWEEYSRIFIGSVTIASGSVSSYTNAYLWDNGFNSTLYDRQVIKTGNIGGYWFRLYSDGWCEQGGRIPGNIGTSGTIALPIPYKDTNWIPIGSCTAGTMTVATGDTTTTMSWTKSSASAWGSWVAYGFAAQSALNYITQ